MGSSSATGRVSLTFLGVGSAFSNDRYYQSNLLLESADGAWMLLDCGGDIRFSLPVIDGWRSPTQLDAVYISHLHADHIGGLEWLAFTTRFAQPRCHPQLLVPSELLEPLWQQSLRGGLGYTTEGKVTIEEYFVPVPLREGVAFEWHGVRLQPVAMEHVVAPGSPMISYGLRIDTAAVAGAPATLFFSSDTRFNPDRLLRHAVDADLILHDCETSPFTTGVHAHYDQLITLDPAVKSRIWLYHYQPDPPQDPLADGFAGFARRGQRIVMGGPLPATDRGRGDG